MDEDIKNEVNSELIKCEEKCKEYLEGWKRERADFLNYKKDEMERIGTLVKYSSEEIILSFLPILDNFYRAEKEMGDHSEEKWAEGFLQIKKQMEEFLKSHGVEEIKTIGEQFDPNFMEAIAEEAGGGPASTELTSTENSGERVSAGSGIVVEAVQKGYKIKGRLLRPARVKVTK